MADAPDPALAGLRVALRLARRRLRVCQDATRLWPSSALAEARAAVNEAVGMVTSVERAIARRTRHTNGG